MHWGIRARRLRRLRLRLLAIDPFCFYCGGRLTAEWSTVDHLEPLSRGGADVESNMVLACRRCNRRKSDLPFEIVIVQRFRGCGLFDTKHILRLAAPENFPISAGD